MNENRKIRLESILNEQFAPIFLDVINESQMHQVPPHAETHFKVIIVSDTFEAKRLLQRHQMIYRHLHSELSSGLHALSLHTFTPKEWQQKHNVLASPACAHSKS